MRYLRFAFVLLLVSHIARSQGIVPPPTLPHPPEDTGGTSATRMYRVSTADVAVKDFTHIAAIGGSMTVDYLDLSYAWKVNDQFSARPAIRTSFQSGSYGLELELDYRPFSHSMDGLYIGPSISYSHNPTFYPDPQTTQTHRLDAGLWIGTQFLPGAALEIFGFGLATNLGGGLRYPMYTVSDQTLGSHTPVIWGVFDPAARFGIGYAW